MKRILLLLAALALLAVPCLADESGVLLAAPPQEVLEHIAGRWPSYALEDYCEIVNTPKGNYGFALLRSSRERLLVGYHEESGSMKYWFRNAGAVPQGGESGWLSAPPKGNTLYTKENEAYLSDGLSFTVFVSDEEKPNRYVAYHWEDGGFMLTGYRDWDAFYGEVSVADGRLHYANWLEGLDAGSVYGDVQRDLRYVSFNALPKTPAEARQKLSSAPDLPGRNGFQPREVKFTGGRQYPVYTGPGELYARSGNGKGSVSTNDWIQVFGEYDGWILIQYDISSDHFRIGWIEASALPKGESVARIGFLEEPDGRYPQDVTEACALTDDPFMSRMPIASLPKGTPVMELVHGYKGWSYIAVEIDGQRMCGFVPTEKISHG